MENNNNSLPNIKFESQEQGETATLMVRAHPITLLGTVVYSAFFFFLLYVSNLFISGFFEPNQTILFNLFASVFIISYAWLSFLNWYFNVGIITNRRVVDIDFYNLLYKEVTTARLDKIEDVTIKSGGFIQSLFNYATIFVQTAGTEANVEFQNVPDPSAIVHQINQLMGKKHHGF